MKQQSGDDAARFVAGGSGGKGSRPEDSRLARGLGYVGGGVLCGKR